MTTRNRPWEGCSAMASAYVAVAVLALLAESSTAMAAKPKTPATPAGTGKLVPNPEVSQPGALKAAALRGAHGQKSGFPRGGMPDSARGYYTMTYGITDLSAKLTESGQLVRFSYSVTDAQRAKPLQDRGAVPAMVDEAAHVSLVVPTMEKVGPLRQVMPAVAGKQYWMAFSNKGGFVKAGHRVSIVIGAVRIDGLVVE